MQKRVLNQRPDFNVSTEQVISSNYYPVNSAIAVVDNDQSLQLTVMNDRSQGGSINENCRIELMINRRLQHDDKRGVNQALNETDTADRGISVPATFYVQYFNYTKQKSMQRFAQLFIDEPLIYHFAFKFVVPPSETAYEKLSPKNNSIGDEYLRYPLKLQFFPIGKYQIHLRFENIFDTFDVHPPIAPNHTMYVSVKQYAEILYKRVNGLDSKLNSINIIETTLTGNQEYATMKRNKINWIGEDDATITEPEYPKDRPNFEIAL